MNSLIRAAGEGTACEDPLASPEPRERLDDSGSVSPPKALDRWLLTQIGRAIGPAPLRFQLWNGQGADLSCRSPVASLLVKDRLTLLRLACDPELQFGEAFTAGRVEVRGDLLAFLEALYRALESSRRRRTRGWSRFFGSNSVRGSRDNIHRHYDLGNDFYALWLDPAMVYTCAYYPSANLGLEEAQKAKLDYVCRKLQLQPGEMVVEAGCGWGALALHMARHYGVSVKAFNISREQLALARERAHVEGLTDRVEFIDGDYRDIDVRADAFVSVGMLEHVGARNYGTLGRVIDRCLGKQSGRGLLHFIGRDRPRPLNAWIRRRIFPGAYAPALGEVMREVLEPWHLSVLDVENLRLHYARTLAQWWAGFERAAERVAGRFGDRFVRAWRLYLAGSQAAFSVGSLQLYQVLFHRPGDNRIPWTRTEWSDPV